MSCAEKLIKHYGDAKATADAFGVSRETIRLWLRDGIPLEKALYVESVSDGVVSAEDILREARESGKTDGKKALAG